MMDRATMFKWGVGGLIVEVALVLVGVAITAYFMVSAANIKADAQRDAVAAFKEFKP